MRIEQRPCVIPKEPVRDIPVTTLNSALSGRLKHMSQLTWRVLNICVKGDIRMR